MLFGFGKRRDNGDIPFSSSSLSQRNQDDNSQHPSEGGHTPPLSPRGPPPTHPMYTNSPMNSPYRQQVLTAASIAAAAAATDNLAIPDIHIFNPVAAAAPAAGGEEETKGQEDEDRINTGPSAESYGSYGTAEDSPWEEQEEQQQQQPYATHGEEEEEPYCQEDPEPLKPVMSYESADFSPASLESLEGGYNEEGGGATTTAYYYEDHRDSSPPVDNYDAQQQYQQTAPPPASSSIDAARANNSRLTPYSTPRTRTPTSSLSTTGGRMSRFRTPNTSLRIRLLGRHEDDAMITPTTASPKSTTYEEIFTPQFKEIHSKTVKRRQNRQQNMQDLERRLASIFSGLANNVMDRERDQAAFLKDHVCKPMEAASERLAWEKDYRTSPYYNNNNKNSAATAGSSDGMNPRHWMTLTTRLSRLDTDMTHHVHVDCPALMRDHLEAPHSVLSQELLPAYETELRQGDASEKAALRAFEGVAATARRRYHEERASRAAAFSVIQLQLAKEAKLESDPARIEEAIGKVRALRAQLEQERVERKMRDESLKTKIEEETMSMKRALLESSGGDELWAGEQQQEIMSAADSVRRTIAYH